MMFSAVRCIVEFMDGETRTYEPVGGAALSPRMSGDGKSPPVVMDLIYKSGEYGDTTHLATIPLVNVRSYRVEPLR
jgi:hypothetical protein